MAQKTFQSARGDTGVSIRVRLIDSRTIDWDLGTVTFWARDDSNIGGFIIEAAAVNIVDITARIVEYQPTIGDPVDVVGRRRCKFVNTEPGGGVVSYPNSEANALFWEVED